MSASELSLGVSPPLIQIDATAPTNIEAPITIENLGTEEVELKIVLKPFTAKNENGQVRYLTDKEYFGPDPLIFQRIQVKEGGNPFETITLAPKQQKKLTLHIDIPTDEVPSDYYFSVVFISTTEPSGESNLTQSAGGIAANVLLSIGPKGKAKGNIEEFTAPIIIEKGPVPFTVRVKNAGEHSIAPYGVIIIENMFGQKVGRVDLLPVNILAGTIRSMPDLQSSDATPSSPILNTKYLIQNTNRALWSEKFLLGPYKATLSIALSEEGPLFTRTIYFIGAPLSAFAAIIISIMLILIIRNRLKTRLEE